MINSVEYRVSSIDLRNILHLNKSVDNWASSNGVSNETLDPNVRLQIQIQKCYTINI